MRCPQILRTRAFILLLIIYLAFFAFLIRSDSIERSQKIKEAERSASLLVGNLAEQQEQTETETLKMLVSLAVSPAVQELDQEACNDLLIKLKRQNRQYSILGALTPDGNLFALSEPFEPGSINSLDQKHVQDAIKTHHFSAGEYGLGRITGVKTMYYGLPVFDSDNNLRAVVVAGFMLDKYTPIIEKAHLSTDSIVVITDRKGVRLYRSPEIDEAPLGKPVPEECFRKISGDGDEGVFEAVGGDGKYRINAFRRLRLREDLPPYLYMLVGYSMDKINQGSSFMMHISLLILGIVGISILGLGWIIADNSSKNIQETFDNRGA